jgi:hypothetical protein
MRSARQVPAKSAEFLCPPLPILPVPLAKGGAYVTAFARGPHSSILYRVPVGRWFGVGNYSVLATAFRTLLLRHARRTCYTLGSVSGQTPL